MQLRIILVIYLSLLTNAFYSYNFGKEAGDYAIANILFGNYEVIAQKIGFINGVNQKVTIDSINNQFFNIDFSFLISDVKNDDDNIFYICIITSSGLSKSIKSVHKHFIFPIK